MSSRPRLAFVSLYDARDHNAYSGAGYAMHRELAKHFELLDWFPLRPAEHLAFAPAKLYYKARGRFYEIMREPMVLRGTARLIQARVKAERPDAIFSPSSIATAHFDGDVPVIWAADLIFDTYIRQYIANPALRWIHNGQVQEAASLRRATRVTFPSAWAAGEAVRAYDEPAEKIDVIPWGANLPYPISRADVERAIERRARDQVEIVFIGKDWVRKGCERVVETARVLKRRGLRAKLTIIGCSPAVAADDSITIHPFLDKHRPEDWAIIERTLSRAHFFFMPSRVEAYGHVFCEAAAFGLVSIGSNAGGIPTIIRNGETGFTRPWDESPEKFADLIGETFADRQRYQRLALAAREDFETRLSWEKFGARLSEQIRSTIQ